jgi:hypothetical protein
VLLLPLYMVARKDAEPVRDPPAARSALQE